MNNWISFSPHIKEKCSVNKIYLMFILAAVPMAFDGIIKYGWSAAIVVASSILTALFCELICNLALYKKFELKEISSVYTGLLIGIVMPPLVPFWMPMIGSAFAIVFVKALAGGTGKNYISEVAAAKVLLAVMFGANFFKFVDPVSKLASVSLLDAVKLDPNVKIDYLNLFLGNTAGAIGETGLLYILIGGAFLCVTKVVDYKLPLSYLLTTFGVSYLLCGLNVAIILTSSVSLVAFFVITDYASSPNSGVAKLIYGIMLGIVTALLFKFGSYACAGYYAAIIGGLIYSAIKGCLLPTKKIVKL